MSDLKVTDVQKIIREYAASGHDITQSPRHVHLDGKPYGMVIGHELGITRNQNWTHLHSYIMQTERPLVTSVLSINDNTKTKEFATRRGVFPLTRHTTISNKGSVSHRYHMAKDLHSHFKSKDGTYAEHMFERQNDQRLWIPNDLVSSYKDIHEAIQSHTSSKISHIGTFISHMGTFYDARNPDTKREMTPKEHSSFNEHEALLHLTDVKPFSGLVHVTDKSHKKRYTYNPQTEELHKHDN